MKKISIVTACYNEEENIEELCKRVKKIMKEKLSRYSYEHIFIDNSSEDRTVDVLKKIAIRNKKIKIIVNSRNFGHVRSPVHGLFQASGDAIISIVADLQDPPEMIPELIEKWENGKEIVLAVKKESEENKWMFSIRKIYYKILESLSDVKIYKNFTGFGLYDKKVMDAIKTLDDPYPFFRGMIAEVGYSVDKVFYSQPKRKRGLTKNNFYSLYDMGITGIINNSKVPLRLAIFISVIVGFLSLITGIVYLGMKLIYWNEMKLGMAPLIILISFIFSVMLFFMGVIGEYIGAIYTQVLNRPLVFEKERINFD